MRNFLYGFLVIGLLALTGFLLHDASAGEKAWQAWKAERMAKGDCFEWACLEPPVVREEDNFAAALIVAAVLKGYEKPHLKLAALKWFDPNKDSGDWRAGQRADLKAYAQSIGEASFSSYLAAIDKPLQEIESASRRPSSRLPMNYLDRVGSDKDLTGFILIGQSLRLRALWRLVSHRTGESLEDVLTCLRIAKHLEAEPYKLASFAQLLLCDTSIQMAWEGIQDRLWTDEQLRLLCDELSRARILHSVRQVLRGDRVFLADQVLRLQETNFLMKLMRGWCFRSLMEMDRFHALCQVDAIEVQNHRIFPERWQTADDDLKNHEKFLAMHDFSLTDHSRFTAFAAHVQSGLDQAAVACALERHRLAKGGYPESLAELLPDFISRVPHDLVNGQPLRYERVGKTYILYSVGWDLKDEGGAFALHPGENQTHNPLEGDWPWIMTAAAPQEGRL